LAWQRAEFLASSQGARGCAVAQPPGRFGLTGGVGNREPLGVRETGLSKSQVGMFGIIRAGRAGVKEIRDGLGPVVTVHTPFPFRPCLPPDFGSLNVEPLTEAGRAGGVATPAR
jgi:hypothetical protein